MCPRVHQEDEDKLKATVKLASGQTIEVTQDVAADLLATVTQAAKDRTITSGDIEVHQNVAETWSITGSVVAIPSGDMARKAYYDREPTPISRYYAASLSSHSFTVRDTYTVPADHKAIHAVLGCTITTPLDTAGRSAGVDWQLSIDGGDNFYRYASTWLYSTTINHPGLTITVTFALIAANAVRMRTLSDDTIAHYFRMWALLTEFDE